MMCDSVAKPILQNMTQFNGHYGCSLCLHPGEQVPREMELLGFIHTKKFQKGIMLQP